MKKVCFVCVLLLFSSTVCHGSSVQWGVSGLGYEPTFNSDFLWVWEPDTCSASASVKIMTSSGNAVIKNNLYLITAGYGMLLVQTEYDTLIDHSLFSNSSGSLFQAYDPLGGIISEKNVAISLYDTVFMAFAIGGIDYGTGEFIELWYGWVALTYDNQGVHVGSSAIETTGLGIYAGTGIVIPEPSSALLALSGLAVFLLRRRRPTGESK